jgi:hypothetical protein
MKRLFLTLASFGLLGAGCWQSLPSAPTTPITPPTSPVAPKETEPTPTIQLVTTTAPTPTPALSPTAPKPTTTKPKTITPTAQPTTPPNYLQFVSGQLQLTHVLSAYGADLSWTKAATRNIKGYAVVKSTTDTNPYYPKQFYTRFINDYDTPTWRDTTIVKGQKTYYRICTIGTDDTVACGNVISVTKP